MSRTPGPDDGAGPALRPLTVTGLLLLDPDGHDPTHVDSVVVDDRGIGVVRRRGEEARLLPWASVVAHAVEPWGGGVVPSWWLDSATPPDEVAGPSVRRNLPHAEPGALISIQTRTGTYRFLRAGADAADLAGPLDAFAVRHGGPEARSTVTTVAPPRLRRSQRTGWARARPWLIAVVVAVVVTAVTLILLQSAGTIHLPILGGGPSGAAPAGPAGPLPPGPLPAGPTPDVLRPPAYA